MAHDTLPPHLGGHLDITHLDISNLKYLKDKYNIKTMIDIGCGPGGMIREAKNLGIEAEGIDGDFTLKFSDISVVINDFTKSSFKFNKTFDLAWSVEFVEHVAKEYIDNYMSVFKEATYVFMTHSPYTGPWHFNVEPSSYWIKLFEEHGFIFMPKETDFIRSNSSMERDFVRGYGHFFLNPAKLNKLN